MAGAQGCPRPRKKSKLEEGYVGWSPRVPKAEEKNKSEEGCFGWSPGAPKAEEKKTIRGGMLWMESKAAQGLNQRFKRFGDQKLYQIILKVLCCQTKLHF